MARHYLPYSRIQYYSNLLLPDTIKWLKHSDTCVGISNTFVTVLNLFRHNKTEMRKCLRRHYKLCFSIFIVPPVALTEAQVVIYIFFRIDIVCSIMGMTENSNTIRRGSLA